jgi:O-6-methylguanine DNA methyltransferase
VTPQRLVSRKIATPLGPMFGAASPRGVCFLEFLQRRIPAALRATAPAESPHLDRLERELHAYFAGRLRRFRVALDLRGTPFQIEVWAQLTRIPYGTTRSYREIAAAVGKPTAFRAVGAANGKNPVSIVVPCHRLVGTTGALTGYGGGLHRKRRLLELERGSPPRELKRGVPPLKLERGSPPLELKRGLPPRSLEGQARG